METALAAAAALTTAAGLAWHRELRQLAARIIASFAEPTKYRVTNRDGRQWCDGDRAGAWRYLAWIGLTRQIDVKVWRSGRPEVLTTVEGAYRPSWVTTYRFLGMPIWETPKNGPSGIVSAFAPYAFRTAILAIMISLATAAATGC